jgi:uncharacterized protein (DUF58 family)
MLTFLRQKQSLRFIVVSALLTGAAIGAAVISALAGSLGQRTLVSLSAKIAFGLALLLVLYVIPRLVRSINWQTEHALQVPNAGLVFSALILVVTILALVSGNNLLYLVLAVLLATMVVSLVAARVSLTRLHVDLRKPQHIFVDEAAPFEITLTSRKRWLPSFSLLVELVEAVPAAARNKQSRKHVELGYFPIIPARTQARTRLERRFKQRGIYPVQGFSISTGFPFGFVEQRRFVAAPGEIVVYPQPQPREAFLDLLPLAQGRVESRLKGQGSDLYAIRPYLVSDHHHHLDWKATAKTARLMVREYTRDDDWRVLVIFDTQVDKALATAPEFAAKFERAVTLTASLVAYFGEEGAEVRLLTGSEDSGFGVGQPHRYAMLRQLAQLVPAESETDDDGRWVQVLAGLTSAEEQFKILITAALPTTVPAPRTRD